MKILPSDSSSARLAVRLTPRACSNAVLRYENGTLSLRLTAPPVEGAANAACCRFVADLLGIAPSRLAVQTGHKSRNKVLAIEGLDQETVQATLTGYGSDR